MPPQNPCTGLQAATVKCWPYKHHLPAFAKGPAELLPTHGLGRQLCPSLCNRGSRFPTGWGLELIRDSPWSSRAPQPSTMPYPQRLGPSPQLSGASTSPPRRWPVFVPHGATETAPDLNPKLQPFPKPLSRAAPPALPRSGTPLASTSFSTSSGNPSGPAPLYLHLHLLMSPDLRNKTSVLPISPSGHCPSPSPSRPSFLKRPPHMLPLLPWLPRPLLRPGRVTSSLLVSIPVLLTPSPLGLSPCSQDKVQPPGHGPCVCMSWARAHLQSCSMPHPTLLSKYTYQLPSHWLWDSMLA